MPAPHPRMHGITHVTGGPDPVPGLLPPQVQASDYTPLIFSHSDLRGYWRLGEGASPYADTSGYAPSSPANLTMNRGYTGYPAPTLDVTPGLLPAAQDDGAVAFDTEGSDGAGLGVAAHLEAGTSTRSHFDFATTHPAMSAVALIKPTASSQSFWGSVVNVAKNMNSSSPDWVGGWSLQVRYPTGEVEMFRGSSPTSQVGATTPAGAVSAGQTSLIVGTYDGATIRVYVDGVLRAAVADTTNLPTLDPLTELRVGGYNGVGLPPALSNGGFWRPFYGVVDEVAVYGSTLSDRDVAALHNAATGAGVPAGSVPVSDGSGGVTWASPPPAPAVTVNGSTMPASKTPKPPPAPPPPASGLDWISDQPFTYDGPSFTVQPETWTTIPFATPVMVRDNPDGTSGAITLTSPDAAGWLTVEEPHAITIPHDMPFDPGGAAGDWMQICLRIDNPPVQQNTSFRALRIFETTHQKTLIQVISENTVFPTVEGGGIDVMLNGSVFASGDTGGLDNGGHPDIFFAPNAGLAYSLNGMDWLPKVSGVPTLKAGMRLVAQAWHDASVPLTFSCANTGGTYKPHFVLYMSCDRAWGVPWSTWPT
jgi:Concanavalin A-like lectin/glucanases superfamily